MMVSIAKANYSWELFELMEWCHARADMCPLALNPHFCHPTPSPSSCISFSQREAAIAVSLSAYFACFASFLSRQCTNADKQKL